MHMFEVGTDDEVDCTLGVYQHSEEHFEVKKLSKVVPFSLIRPVPSIVK